MRLSWRFPSILAFSILAYNRYAKRRSSWLLGRLHWILNTKLQSLRPFAPYTVIRFVWVSAKFGTCTVVSVNRTLVEVKMCTITLESTHFIFNKCPMYTHNGASAKFSTNSHGTDYSVFFSTAITTVILFSSSVNSFRTLLFRSFNLLVSS